jgi:hypothetical protein
MEERICPLPKEQEFLILLICLALVFDAGISIYGATYKNALFFEANPIMAAAHDLTTFTYAVMAGKIILLTLIVLVAAYLNRNLGEQWGTMLCKGSLACVGILIGSMVLINVILMAGG